MYQLAEISHRKSTKALAFLYQSLHTINMSWTKLHGRIVKLTAFIEYDDIWSPITVFLLKVLRWNYHQTYCNFSGCRLSLNKNFHEPWIKPKFLFFFQHFAEHARLKQDDNFSSKSDQSNFKKRWLLKLENLHTHTHAHTHTHTHTHILT